MSKELPVNKLFWLECLVPSDVVPHRLAKQEKDLGEIGAERGNKEIPRMAGALRYEYEVRSVFLTQIKP